jgi:glycosyltransferase involved in cell wall biosynthesis
MDVDPPPGQIVVIDNAPTTDATADVCEHLGVERHVERRLGLDRARNSGWRISRSPIICYVDDDTRADSQLAARVAEQFTSSDIAAVTGLVLPAEVTTRAQYFFETHGGMRKGFAPRRFQTLGEEPALEPQEMGVGANMSFRRHVLEQLGGFDPCLDLGTETNGGGDLDMLYRVLEAGSVVMYSPDVLVRHLHRRDTDELLRQMHGYGMGYSAFLAKRSAGSPVAGRRVRAQLWRWHLSRHVLTPLTAVARGDFLRVRTALAEARGGRLGGDAYRREVALLRSERRTG